MLIISASQINLSLMQAGIENANVDQIIPKEEEEQDNSAYFYAILGLLPVLAIMFYFLIKKKGGDNLNVLSYQALRNIAL